MVMARPHFDHENRRPLESVFDKNIAALSKALAAEREKAERLRKALSLANAAVLAANDTTEVAIWRAEHAEAIAQAELLAAASN
jgi:predicted RNase H-like nuclease (RuvC/YqgF family)